MTARRVGLALAFTGFAVIGNAQPVPAAVPVPPVTPFPRVIDTDAQQTRRELMDLMRRYPPNLLGALRFDPSLLTNQSYLATYPALAAFVAAHPEVPRNPSFYVGEPSQEGTQEPKIEMAHAWQNILSDAEATVAGIMAMSLIAYLIRTFMDSRRWLRWTKVQTEAHTKLLDRFSGHEDLLAYINSPAGSKFLESSPIHMESAARSNLIAPVGRILWTVQGGVVLIAGGIGLELISRQITDDAQEPVHALGILAMALGIGFVVSAIISFGISQRLGLIEHKNAS